MVVDCGIESTTNKAAREIKKLFSACTGGPGGPIEYLLPLADLADHGYRVVMYEQTGTGKSEIPKDRSLFTVEYYVEEVEEIRRKLGLGNFHLYGHSWGGMLAQAYALNHQKNLKSLILSGTTSSVPLLELEGKRLLRSLPKKLQNVVAKYESEENYDNPKYLKAIDYFTKKHAVRMKTWPEEVLYTYGHFTKIVGDTMFGPKLVTTIGDMRYWDVTEKLSQLDLSCLIIVGQYDFLTPKLHRLLNRKIRGSELVVIPGASHASLWEKRMKYINTIVKFLEKVRTGKDPRNHL